MKPKYEVHLCKSCIEQLEEDYYFSVPREQLNIVEVPVADCDNEDLDNYNAKLNARNPDWVE